MTIMRESIFFGSLRALFSAFAALIGITLGLFVLIMFFAALAGSDQLNIRKSFTPEVSPDAQGERKILDSNKPIILKADIQGIIGMSGLTASQFRQMLIESREGALSNSRVKALVLHINTPGGTVIDADGIYRAIKAYKKQYEVPVIAYVDGLSLSGGMYVASAADKIFASDTSLIGSVGVILAPFFNISSLMEKVGLQAMTIYAGKGKDEMNPTRPWQKGEDENLATITQEYYNLFVKVVTEARPNMDKQKLVDEYGAKAFMAETAKEHGYIDEIVPNFEVVLGALASQLNMTEGNYQVVTLTSSDWFSKLFEREGVVNKSQVAIPLELDAKLAGQWLYLQR